MSLLMHGCVMVARPLSQWLALVVAVVISLTGLASYFIIDHMLGNVATARVNNRARAVMEAMLSVRQYASANITPIIEPINLQQSQHFMPESVPSYTAKSVFAAMQEMPQYRNYRYREVVTDPTNREDLPSELEAVIISRFKSNPKLQEVSGDDVNPILSYHFTARPLTVTGESCLRCHSTPERAPLSLVNTYGSKNGFGWKVGETIGAQIVKVPLEIVDEKKTELKKDLLGLILTGLVALALVMFFVLDHFIVRPLTKLSLIADSASQTPSTVAFPKNGPVDELNRLQRSLERLRVSLLVAMNLANKP